MEPSEKEGASRGRPGPPAGNWGWEGSRGGDMCAWVIWGVVTALLGQGPRAMWKAGGGVGGRYKPKDIQHPHFHLACKSWLGTENFFRFRFHYPSLKNPPLALFIFKFCCLSLWPRVGPLVPAEVLPDGADVPFYSSFTHFLPQPLRGPRCLCFCAFGHTACGQRSHRLG